MLIQKNAKMISDHEHQHLVSIEDRGFLYGDGCFSTAQFIRGEIQLWQGHLARFEKAISALCLNCDMDRINTAKVKCLDQISAQYGENAQGTIKVLISRGQGQRGYAPPDQDADLYFYFYPQTAFTTEIPTLEKVGLIDQALSTPMQQLRGIKSLNRLEQVLLKHQANQQAWQEALCFDQHEHLVEGISSNCFVYLEGQWHTPDLALAGIDGVMRQEILSRMQHFQIAHQIRKISRSELASVQAIFLCNALHPMQIVHTLIVDQVQQTLDHHLCEQLFQQLQLHDF
ncbi:4-amino-4-deoxychorismate lyase [Acinetobacter marinus]|uniref:Aminodeoxychorismate lyase n=1 Tax=Acinetobacter marinus TaxID=281375 RepID=A0A1G6P5K0_9GAMM|nr:aminodeoxychorismate lyase [Acinetobacter marinus]SDC74884.1 4-amino-4-deoxychorismate lyase [Acinetobacter marinus]